MLSAFRAARLQVSGTHSSPSLSRPLMTLRATLCRHRVRTQSRGDLPALEQRVLWQGAPLTRPRCLIWSENNSTSLDRAPNVAREGSWLTQEGGCKSLPLEGGKENLLHSAPKIYFCRLTEVAKCESGEAPWTEGGAGAQRDHGVSWRKNKTALQAPPHSLPAETAT